MVSALTMLLLLLAPLPIPRAASYEGTIQAIKTQPAAVDLVTGVGFALRMIRVRTVPATTVDSAGTPIPMSHIQVGDLVRIDCSATATGLVADHIAKLDARGSRGTP